MAGRKLSTYVHIDGMAYGPDDDVPAEVAERITAPGVWADESDDEKSTRRKPAAKASAGDDKA